MTRTRIVAVSYLNTIPYIYGITRAGGSLREGLLLCPPRLCAEALRTGEANVGLIPVAAIPEIPDLQIITPFCIGASGPVRTVVLASDYPVEELDTIWLDSHSRTSVRLARILAAEKWGIAPQWRPLTDYSFGTGAAAGTHGTIPAAEATGTGGAAGTGTGTGTESGTGKSGYILIGDKVFDHEAPVPLPVRPLRRVARDDGAAFRVRRVGGARGGAAGTGFAARRGPSLRNGAHPRSGGVVRVCRAALRL